MCKPAADIAYVRVSSLDQNTARQFDGQLEEFARVFEDKCSGKDVNRPALQECLAYLREGDCLHVWSIDRLARNLSDLERIVKDLNARGVSVKFHKEGMLFEAGAEASPMNTLLLQVLGSFAQFERALIAERRREGIASAKERGAYSGENHKGRKAVVSSEGLADIKARVEAGEKVTAIAAELGVSRQAVYKMLKNA